MEGGLRERFTVQLIDRCAELDPHLVDAFRAVPRHLFVPSFFDHDVITSRWRLVEHPDPEWLEKVWSPSSLITQLNGDDSLEHRARGGELVRGVSTSSSSAPTLMAFMLQALDVRVGHRVLEVGTGTGYNAALLCHLLGDHVVTTVEVDSGVSERAAARLAELGHRPTVIVGDGMEGAANQAPFDRIIATVGVPRVPVRWLSQTVDGGKILFPLALRNSGGLMPLLTVSGGSAQGNFLSDYGGFMPIRSLGTHGDAALEAFKTHEADDGRAGFATSGEQLAKFDGQPFEFFVALRTGGLDWMSFTPSDKNAATECWMADGADSWLCHRQLGDGRSTVNQGGPRNLWDTLEKAYQEWLCLGSPPRERFGLTVNGEGAHRIWLDSPIDQRHWILGEHGMT